LKKHHLIGFTYKAKKDKFNFSGFPAVYPGKQEMQKGWDSRKIENGKSREVKPNQDIFTFHSQLHDSEV
jgi:hypothetical protein